jgi:hypothetical protein
VTLQREKEEVEQQRNLAAKEIQTNQEQMNTTLETEQNNLKGFKQDIDKLTKQASTLNYCGK